MAEYENRNIDEILTGFRPSQKTVPKNTADGSTPPLYDCFDSVSIYTTF